MGSINLDRANAKLDRVKILQRGNKLSIRGRFPPKPGDGSKPKRYIIPTGLSATATGLKLALAKAQQLESDLIYERFTWNLSEEISVAQATALFEKDYWNTREKTINRVSNFKKDYKSHFLYLPQEDPCTADLLKSALINSSEADSRKRKGRAIAYSALLNFLDIKHDLTRYKGSYKPTKKRELPTEEEILYYYENNCKSPQWRWVFGIIACYGVRPHEVFRCDPSGITYDDPALKILENSKTGERIVYPIPSAELPIKWNLQEIKLPRINTEGKSNQILGNKISTRFWHLKIPSPYHFRDAYAVRGEIYNFNPAMVAQWMGHSLATHDEKYLRHIQKTHLKQAWQKLQHFQKLDTPEC